MRFPENSLKWIRDDASGHRCCINRFKFRIPILYFYVKISLYIKKYIYIQFYRWGCAWGCAPTRRCHIRLCLGLCLGLRPHTTLSYPAVLGAVLGVAPPHDAVISGCAWGCACYPVLGALLSCAWGCAILCLWLCLGLCYLIPVVVTLPLLVHHLQIRPCSHQL